MRARARHRGVWMVLASCDAPKQPAQGLADAGNPKNAALPALNEDWAALAAVVPRTVAALDRRIDRLGKQTAGQPAVSDALGVDSAEPVRAGDGN